MKNNNKQIMYSIIGIALLLIGVVGVTFAFFNYTRTGSPNTLKLGNITFNSTQDNTISLTNVFPTSSTNLNSSNSDTVTININGSTSYSEGIEYKVTLEDVNNTINDKELPISFNVTANNLGTKSSNYYSERGQETNVYNLIEQGQVEDGKYILVGYIKPDETGVNGSIDITAFIDADRVAISDTVSRIDNGNLIYGETRGEWIAGRTVFTTTEWNSFQTTPISFKVRVEANEGIWVEEEPFFVMKNLYSDSNWTGIRANITSVEFHKDGVAPDNPIASFDATDVTSSGPVTIYTVDDGLGNNTYKAIVVADDVIYAPENSQGLFMNMSNLVTFNSQNFKVDNSNNLQYLFAWCSNLLNIDSLLSWNVSNVINMQAMFNNCSNLTNTSSLANWNVSNVTNMQTMFNNCSNLTNISSLANWNVSSVNNMEKMFSWCPSLTDITYLSNWNVGNVTNMNGMFGLGSNQTKINDAVIDFSPLANWNVSKVENMSTMFQNVNILSYQAFANWNVSKVKNFSNMFNQTSASTVTTLDGLENWNVSSATNMLAMFQDNVRLTDASAINNWNINSSIDFTEMFANTPVHPEFTKVSGTWDSEGTFTPNA